MIYYAVFVVRKDRTEYIAFAPNGGRAVFEMERDAETCARTLRRQGTPCRIGRVRLEEIKYR